MYNKESNVIESALIKSSVIKSSVIEEIAAVIAHEIKNPLTMLKANIEIIEAAGNHDSLEKNFHMIHKEINRINEIMADFIHLSRQPTTEMDIVYPEDIIELLCREISISTPRTEINIRSPQPDICVLGDERSLKILFSNILKNALEAMEFKGFINISITSHQGYVEIAFLDSGSGFGEETAERLFNQHFTTKATGSGLGLSICQNIAAEHGGSFTLTATLGGGCSACVRLPIYHTMS